MHEGPTENRLGELGSLYKYYYYYYYIYIASHDVTLQQEIGTIRYIFFSGLRPRLSRLECAWVSRAVRLKEK